MAYIEVHDHLFDHPKLANLADELESDERFYESDPEDRLVACLVRLWQWSLTNGGLDGDLSRFKPRALAVASGWKGDPVRFVAALKSTGWLNQDGTIHDWTEYAGRLLIMRARNKNRMRKARADLKEESAKLSSDDTDTRVSVTTKTQTHVSDTCEATRPNPTRPDLTIPDPNGADVVLRAPAGSKSAAKSGATPGKKTAAPARAPKGSRGEKGKESGAGVTAGEVKRYFTISPITSSKGDGLCNEMLSWPVYSDITQPQMLQILQDCDARYRGRGEERDAAGVRSFVTSFVEKEVKAMRETEAAEAEATGPLGATPQEAAAVMKRLGQKGAT